ncbi:hypothetical protein BsWGS_21273 [Bradybaena similaris]
MMAEYTSYFAGAIFLGVVTVLLVKLAESFKSFCRRRALYRKFPQNPTNFLFGILREYPGPDERGLAMQREMTKKFPMCFLTWMMQTPMIVVNHPDTVKVILKSTEPKGEITYKMLRPWIGDGLLTSKGKKWARNRRLLTPAFHFTILKNYIELKNRCADLILNKFDQAAKAMQPFHVFANVSMYTLDVILRSAMSYETDCQKLGESHPYVQAVNKISELLVDRFFKPWLYNEFIYSLTPSGWRMKKHCDFVHNVAEDIINRRKDIIKREGFSDIHQKDKYHWCLDFLDILLTARDENNIGLTNEEIRDEVDTFLFEGHDTTASAISWALYSIAEHQDIQKRIQEELDNQMFGRTNEDVLWEDLTELPYLTMVIKESLRLHSPVPFIQRELTVDTDIDGYIAPAGTLVSVILYNAHHNPLIWGDTLKFDPDRFLPENVEARSSYAFVPFSAGPRNCIGQNFAMHEIKIVLARILRKFTIRLEPDFKVEKAESLVMRAKNDIHLLVAERQVPRG